MSTNTNPVPISDRLTTIARMCAMELPDAHIDDVLDAVAMHVTFRHDEEPAVRQVIEASR